MDFSAARFISKTVPFQFRGTRFNFALSQGLFSSADIDTGTRLLLKVFSRLLDEDAAAGKPSPAQILDAGCGVGVIGICAAKGAAAGAASALPETVTGPRVRCQDRDELARLITMHNAAHNGIPPAVLEAHTEPLLAGPESGWDFILTNIPAKAGKPVLEDFVRRSAGLLNPGGRVVMVAVQPLADFFRGQIADNGELIQEEHGPGHCVLVYRGKSAACKGAAAAEPVHTGTGFFERYPFYVRSSVNYRLENISVQLAAVHGASGFDAPGGPVEAAAKLAVRLGAETLLNDCRAILIHEPEQGFFPCWLTEFLRSRIGPPPEEPKTVLSGRNMLALEAARYNLARYRRTAEVIPAADLYAGGAVLRKAAGTNPYNIIAAFPQLLPGPSLSKSGKSTATDQMAALWEALPPLLASGGIFLAAFSSADAERFDRKKPPGFTRLGGIRRKGFRALAYRRIIY